MEIFETSEVGLWKQTNCLHVHVSVGGIIYVITIPVVILTVVVLIVQCESGEIVIK